MGRHDHIAAKVVGLDLLFMSINFSALTLFGTLGHFFIKSLGMTSSEVRWAAAAYSIGIFAAFFVGHSRFVENHPKLTVFTASILASIPQFLIPALRSPYAIIILRFLQGMVMMAVPIFSSQVGRVLSHARPFALGIILSGIFIGGFIGSNVGWSLAIMYSWRFAYILFGILMLIVAGVWILATPQSSLPIPTHAEGKPKKEFRKGSKFFTLVWGFTFFPSIWIIFTLAPLIMFVVESISPSLSRISSEVLEASYTMWSIVIGFIAYMVSRRGSGEPRSLFQSFAKVQAACFILALIGAICAYVASTYRNPSMLLVSLFILAAIQGTAPTFWSIPATAYSKEESTRAGYTLGLISNSAALIGPIASILIASLSTGMWLLTSALSVVGLVLTLASLKLRLPIES